MSDAIQQAQLEPKDHARELLRHFFNLQRHALSGGFVQDMERCGWTMEHHLVLTRLLGHGCHNLVEIVERNDAGQLRHEVEWLYEHAAVISYPACWAKDGRYSITWRSWEGFWTVIAQILDREPRLGQPWEKVETQEEAHYRLLGELHARNLVLMAPWWARLLGLAGNRVTGVFEDTPAGRYLAEQKRLQEST